MALLKRLFAPRLTRSQQQVAGRAQVGAPLHDPAARRRRALDLPVSGLVNGLIREFKAQSPAFRALP
jgi:hypothetical protein